ncbi:hypothetical protein CMV_012140 [Castanea mollissima]|uniref:Uncharacterized protein n=1 Tax=Castanea mollissima TaxID=60419 RepID=A0A8J4VJF4_9ROSI|nr:hypothetical protein CMV_012140 [Castanea mollissima]
MKVAPLISTKIMKLLVASSLREEVLLLEKGYIPSECSTNVVASTVLRSQVLHFSVFHDSSRSAVKVRSQKALWQSLALNCLYRKDARQGNIVLKVEPYKFCSGYCCDPMHAGLGKSSRYMFAENWFSVLNMTPDFILISLLCLVNERVQWCIAKFLVVIYLHSTVHCSSRKMI